MTATEELRRLLDERGVKWWQSANTLGCIFTRWYSPIFGDEVVAMENGEEGLVLFDHFLTPAQAIAATLGSGTCELESVITFFKGQERTTWACKSCGARFESFMPNVQRDEYHIPRFCPNCGRRVE